MRPRLTPEEKRRRRQERLRLITYLHRGGHVVREDLPSGVVGWVRADRSGVCFSDRSVQRILRRRIKIRGAIWFAVRRECGQRVYLEADDREATL